MKTMRLFFWMMICCLSAGMMISCEKDEMDTMHDESLFGTWVLDDVLCRVNATDEYVAEILQEKIKEDFIYMEDTIQFAENGYFFEGSFIVEDASSITPEDVSIPMNYKASSGHLIITPWANETVIDKVAEYEIDANGDVQLVITADIMELFSYETFLNQVDQDPTTVKNIEYKLIYKKID